MYNQDVDAKKLQRKVRAADEDFEPSEEDIAEIQAKLNRRAKVPRPAYLPPKTTTPAPAVKTSKRKLSSKTKKTRRPSSKVSDIDTTPDATKPEASIKTGKKKAGRVRVNRQSPVARSRQLQAHVGDIIF